MTMAMFLANKFNMDTVQDAKVHVRATLGSSTADFHDAILEMNLSGPAFLESAIHYLQMMYQQALVYKNGVVNLDCSLMICSIPTSFISLCQFIDEINEKEKQNQLVIK